MLCFVFLVRDITLFVIYFTLCVKSKQTASRPGSFQDASVEGKRLGRPAKFETVVHSSCDLYYEGDQSLSLLRVLPSGLFGNIDGFRSITFRVERNG